MLFTAVCGVILGEVQVAWVFAGLSILVGLASAIVSFTAQNAPMRESTRDVLVFLFLFWLLIPIVASIPFAALNVVPNWITAYFEAVSAVTTTGASTLIPEQIPKTLLLWRSVLQWSGGCVVATFAVVLLAALNLSGTGVHKSIFFTLKKGELFSRLIGIGRIIAALYIGFASICFLFLVLSGTGPFDALCLSLSAVSTGGLTPRSGPLNPYVSNFGGIALAITCLLGAANISILWDLVRRRNLASIKETILNVEHRGTLAIVTILFLTGFLYAGPMHMHTVFVESAYMASTTGFDFHVLGVDLISPSILIALVLVGGSALSTAGGIKIIRMLLLLRHLRTDLDRMSHPSRVVSVQFQGQKIEDKAFLSIWMYFFAYTLVFAIGIVALGGAGLDFPAAVAACAATLSNTGPLLEATYPEHSYANMNPLVHSILIVVMLLGRIEVLAAFAAVTPSQWRR
jgi:trk system potassium uptake protein TrkH